MSTHPRTYSLGATAARVLLAATFLFAAYQKTVHPLSLAGVIARVVSPIQAPGLGEWLGVCVVVFEVALGLALLLGLGRNRTLGIVAGGLVVFSLAILRLLVERATTGCGCFGMPSLGASGRTDLLVALARNGCLLLVVAWVGLRDAEPSPAQPGLAASAQAPNSPPTRNAFTVVEVLVSLMVVSILISLAAPPLFRARENARGVALLATDRQVYVATQAYGGDFRDAFPFFATPGDPFGPKIMRGQSVAVDFFRGQSRMFVNLLWPAYLAEISGLAVDPPGSMQQAFGWPEGIIRSRLNLTYGCFSAAAYWAEAEPPTVPPDPLFSPSSWHDILFPARKGLLLDFGPVRGAVRDAFPRRWTMVAGDGAGGPAVFLNEADYLRATVARSLAAARVPILSTQDGLRGIDMPR